MWVAIKTMHFPEIYQLLDEFLLTLDMVCGSWQRFDYRIDSISIWSDFYQIIVLILTFHIVGLLSKQIIIPAKIVSGPGVQISIHNSQVDVQQVY